MIFEKRLFAKMDQLTGFIEFSGGESTKYNFIKEASILKLSHFFKDDDLTATWNDQIFKFCVNLNKFLENVGKKY